MTTQTAVTTAPLAVLRSSSWLVRRILARRYDSHVDGNPNRRNVAAIT